VAISLAPFAGLFHFLGRTIITRAARNVGLIFCALVVCATSGAAKTRPPEGGRYKGDDELRQAPAYKRAMRQVTDETGRRVQIPLTVRNIVTLAPNLTETVYALGLGERLAGDTTYCDSPPAAKDKPHVGAPQNPSLEAIVALHPDLVLATTSINSPQTADALAAVGIAVYTSDPHTVRGMLDSIARMADLMDAREQGATLVAQLQARLDVLRTRLADLPLVHVLFVVWEDPLITIGPSTFIADALRWAGAESVIVAKQNWPQVSIEEIVRLQPEYIVLTPNHDESSTAHQIADLRSRPAWKGLRAVEMGHVAVVGEEFIRPSPGLIDAIEQLAHELHHEAFAKNTLEQREQRIENGASASMPLL
jgi:iron complex transport system substrate-binding protein